jgi:hypothetical protein
MQDDFFAIIFSTSLYNTFKLHCIDFNDSYHSLHTSNKNQTDSLFLHVPPFEIVPNERQIEFVRSLIQKIGRIYLEGR